MAKNPFLNALAAALYIVVVALVMHYGPRMASRPDGVMVPIAVISLFTLPAAVMGYVFLYQPVQLYLDGEKKECSEPFR